MQQTDLSTARARALRHAMTPAERALWQALRDRRFQGLKIRRQVPIGPHIADFYCAEHRLIIDTDGGLADARHDRWLSAQGFRLLRLPARDVLGNLPGCLGRIAARTGRPARPPD